MSYLVLARKWRPQKFSEVIAQPHVVQALQNAIKLDRLPHALLLTGSRGVGKTTIARLVAKTVNCLQPDLEALEPCNQCDMCKEITEGRSVDVIEIDGASNRSIDDIREIRDNVQYMPTKGTRKVHIIDEVHMLTREAFNALLKTLEEPPPHVMFLFATTEPHKIPVTILSRCQRFDFKRIPLDVLRSHLKRITAKEEVQISDSALAMVARAAEGGARDAMSLMDQVIAFGGNEPTDEAVAQAIGVVDRQLLMQIGQALLEHDAAGCLQAINELFYFAYDLRQFTQELASFLRDMVVVGLCEDVSGIVDLTDEELAAMRTLMQGQETERVQQMFRILTQAAEEIAQSNHPRLLLEMALIRMARVEPVRPFEELIGQLAQMEERLLQLADEAPQMLGGAGGGAGGVSGGSTSLAGFSATLQAQQQAVQKQQTASQGAPSSGLSVDSASSGEPRPASASPPEAKPAIPTASSPEGSVKAPSQAPASSPSTQVPQGAAGDIEVPKPEGSSSSSSHLSDVSSNQPAPKADTGDEASVKDVSLSPASSTQQVAAPASPTPAKDTVREAARQARADAPSQNTDTQPKTPAPEAVMTEVVTTKPPASKATTNGVSRTSQAKDDAPVHEAFLQASEGFSLADWEKVVRVVADRQNFFAGSLRSARYRVKEGVLELAFKPDELFLGKNIDDTKTHLLEECLKKLGWSFSVKLVSGLGVDLADFVPCLAEAHVMREEAEQAALEEEAKKHTAVRAVLSAVPGSRIVRVIPIVPDVVEEEEDDESGADA